MQHLENASSADLLCKIAGTAAADALMERYEDLTDISKASLDELQHIKGIGESKAAAIKAAFLLAQRLSREVFPDSPVMDRPELIADFLRESNRPYVVENFQVVFLNTRRRMMGVQIISQGTLDTILVSPREVFFSAIAKRASAIILVHNLCAAAHKLCYVKCRFMCSDRLTALRLIRSREQARGSAVLSLPDVVLRFLRISPRRGCHA